jgi:CO/xanthine dehydrogenase Mo-binding subunit
MVLTDKPRRQAAPRRPIEQWEYGARIDLLDKVTGGAQYLDDLPNLPGTIYAWPIKSPFSHARVVSIDSSRAEALPGVLGVLHRDQLDGFDPGVRVGEYRGHTREHGETADQHFVTTDKARFDGDFLGIVAAEDLRTAQIAAEMVDIEWEILPTVFSYAEAMAPDAPLIHEDLGTNLAHEDSFEWGDLEAGFAGADRVVEASYYTGNVFHHPMEPSGGCLANFTDGGVDLWFATNKPFSPADQIAEIFGIDPDRVRVRVPPLGGAFGSKKITPAIMGAIALSRRIGRPVRLYATAEQSFRVTARHAALYRARAGVAEDGKVTALDVQLEVDTGAYFTGARLVTRNMCISSWGAYAIPNFRVRAKTAYTNKVPAASFRGTGKSQTTFGIEALMDRIAREMKISPLDLRLKNVPLRGQYIADSWTVQGVEYPADTPPMDADFDQMLQVATESIGWDGTAGGSGPMEVDGRRVARGRGVALSLRHGAQGAGRAYAMATMHGDGTVKISHAAPDLGGGTYNMISTVAARSLGIPQEMVRVGEPDTGHDLHFEGSSAQRTTVQMGNAVLKACESLKRELADGASQIHGGDPSEWSVADGAVSRGSERYPYADIVQAFAAAPSFEGVVSLKGLGAYSYAPSPDRAFGGLDHWAPGAAAAEVEVDLDTGEVRLLQLAVVADVGKALHYGAARTQAEGGAVMGIGLSLFEDLVYEEEQLLNADPFQYRLPLMRDIPEAFDAELIENGDGPGPFGSKGMSQTSLPATIPAIGNAIYDATGVQITSVPFSPEKILRALREHQG